MSEIPEFEIAVETPQPYDIAKAAMSRLADRDAWAGWAVIPVLLVMMVVIGIIKPIFVSETNLQNISVAAAILIVLTIGQAFVLIGAGIDLSLGSNVEFSSVVLGWSLTHGIGMASGIALALGAATLVGVINGVVIAKGGVNDFIVTLGSMSAIAGLALLLSNATPLPVTSPFLFHLAAGSLFGPVTYFFIIPVILAVLGHFALFHTAGGVALRATGGKRAAAQRTGINVTGVKIATYAIAGFLAGIGGVMLTARLGAADPTAGGDYLLNSVAGTVLGGVSLFGGEGNVVGPVFGAILLTAIINALTILGVSLYFQPVSIGLMVVLAALLTKLRR